MVGLVCRPGEGWRERWWDYSAGEGGGRGGRTGVQLRGGGKGADAAMPIRGGAQMGGHQI